MQLSQNVRLDRAFHALSNPIRRGIVDRLTRYGSASVSDLAAPFDVSLMGITKHVAVLEDAGLVESEKRGRTRFCSIDPRGLETAIEWLEHHRRFWETQLDQFGRHLAENPEHPNGEKHE